MDLSLSGIAKELNTQDNRITQDPLFVVQEKVRTWGMDENYADDYEFIKKNSEGEVAEGKEREKLLLAHWDAECLKEWDKVHYKDEWQSLAHTASFCAQSVQDYVDHKAYRHTDELRTYAESANANPEFKFLRRLLMADALLPKEMPRELPDWAIDKVVDWEGEPICQEYVGVDRNSDIPIEPETIRVIHRLLFDAFEQAQPRDTVAMPKRLTAENGAKYRFSGEYSVDVEDSDENAWLVEIPWTQMKEMYKDFVEFFMTGNVQRLDDKEAARQSAAMAAHEKRHEEVEK